MENASVLAKQGIMSIIAQNLGYKVSSTFRNFYEEEPMPIFLDSAVKTLGDFLGKKKAKKMINEVLLHYHLKDISTYV